jgi:hypothetical protein
VRDPSRQSLVVVCFGLGIVSRRGEFILSGTMITIAVEAHRFLS